MISTGGPGNTRTDDEMLRHTQFRLEIDKASCQNSFLYHIFVLLTNQYMSLMAKGQHCYLYASIHPTSSRRWRCFFIILGISPLSRKLNRKTRVLSPSDAVELDIMLDDLVVGVHLLVGHASNTILDRRIWTTNAGELPEEDEGVAVVDHCELGDLRREG